jgi:hypothetical protein
MILMVDDIAVIAVSGNHTNQTVILVIFVIFYDSDGR